MGDVLACIDFSDGSELVVDRAAAIAVGLGARMHLLHVAADEPALAGYDKESLGTFTRTDRARQLLDEHEGLRLQAERLEADGPELIAVGSHGHGAMHHLLVGSVSELLLKSTTRPVLVVPTILRR
jgi:nucleotide-binding universal stress UspA family protein